MYGHDGKDDLILCVLSDGGEYRVDEVQKNVKTDPTKHWVGTAAGRSYGLGLFLSHARPGKWKSPWEQEPVELKNDGFEISYLFKAATLFFFSNGKFKTYHTKD